MPWLADHAILDKKGTGVVHSNFLKDMSRRHTLQRELSHHLWLWSHSLAPTCQALTCDRSDCLPEIEHMKPVTEGSQQQGRSCMQQTVMLRMYNELGDWMLSMQDHQMTTGV